MMDRDRLSNRIGGNGMTTIRSRRQILTWVSGLVIAGLIAVVAIDNHAQEKKESKDAKGKVDPKGKKESKTEKAPTNYPGRDDFVDPAFGGVQHVTMIDDHIKDGWKKNNTFPSERCTDHEFIRRASLDIIGRIPTPDEIKRFLAQPDKKRRSWLINELLDGPIYGNGKEYAQNFANIWTVLLLTRSGSTNHAQDQMNDWLYNHFKGDEKASPAVVPNWTMVVKELISGKGNSNQNNAVNYLLHNLGEQILIDEGKGKATKLDTEKNGRWDMVPATSRTTRLFLGIRTQCVQCHNHPFNGEWKQENFWGINAFFREIDTPRGRPTMMAKKKKKDKNDKIKEPDFDLVDNGKFNKDMLVPYEPRNNLLLFTDPTFLDGKKIPKNWTGTRREALAKFMIESPYVSKAFVNRTWGHFFGKSFTRDAVDDFHEGNPPSYPELLDKLSEDWAKDYGYNPKVLIRWICNSQAYGLSSKANKWNDKTDDETLFARMLLKPMSPEQMFDSMMIATARIGAGEKAKEAKQEFLGKLVVSFGNDEGEEGNFSGTVVQALMLMNGVDINNAISDPKDGAVAAIVKKRGASYASLKLAINDMFIQVLGRPATTPELTDLMSPGNSKKPAMFHFRKDPPGSIPNNPQFWTRYYEDIMWALINSNEFILNH